MRDFIRPQLRLVRYIEFQYNRFPNHPRGDSDNGNGHSSLARYEKIPAHISEDNIPDDFLDPNAWGFKVYSRYEGWIELNGMKIKIESQPLNISKITYYGQRVGTIEEFEKEVFRSGLDSSLARSLSWKNVLKMVCGDFCVFDPDHQFRQVPNIPAPQ